MIIGLDLSLTATGLVALPTAGDEPICTKLISFPKLTGEARLCGIWDTINAELSKEVDLVVTEGYSFGSQGRATFSIGELGGVIKTGMWTKGVKYYIASPSSLKMFATQKGTSPKEVVIREVFRRWNREFDNNNIADAYVLAKIGQAIYAVQQCPSAFASYKEYERRALLSVPQIKELMDGQGQDQAGSKVDVGGDRGGSNPGGTS